jgi:hypothetical protein
MAPGGVVSNGIHIEGVSADEWAARYKLDRKPIQCPKCKEKFIPSIPFALKGYRGLKCEPHPCGVTHQAYVVKPIGEKLDEWNKMLYGEGERR